MTTGSKLLRSALLAIAVLAITGGTGSADSTYTSKNNRNSWNFLHSNGPVKPHLVRSNAKKNQETNNKNETVTSST